MQLRRYLWTIPFCAFLVGYVGMRSCIRIHTIEVPALVGATLFEAFPLLSHHKLTPRLLEQREDAELPEGTIISQTPVAGQKVKPYQSLFLVVSRKPKAIIAPDVVHQSWDEIQTTALSLGLRLRPHYLASIYPTNSCIAQIPLAESSMVDSIFTVYLSSGSQPMIVWPQCIGRSYTEVQEFLSLHGITPHIMHTPSGAAHAVSDACIILDQRPLAGSLISLEPSKVPVIQFQVS